MVFPLQNHASVCPVLIGVQGGFSLKAVWSGLLCLGTCMPCRCFAQLWMLSIEKYVPVAQLPSESCCPGLWGQLLTVPTAESSTLWPDAHPSEDGLGSSTLYLMPPLALL